MKRITLLAATMLATGYAALADVTASGTIVDELGNPIAGAFISVPQAGIGTVTDQDGMFKLSVPDGINKIDVEGAGYQSASVDIKQFLPGGVGMVALVNEDLNTTYYEESQDMWFDEHALEDEEGTSQSITALTGASDDIYYNAQIYNFQPMYFRYRGYDSQYQTTYINGVAFNDLARGRFSYSSLGGMTSRAFRNRTSAIGMAAADYGFSDIAGSTNINTITSTYSPGFNGSVAYTNSNYMLRAMATYSTGINKNGWGMTVSAIGRWSDEGIVEGTWYNSFGGFLSLEKVFNTKHSLTLTAFAAPTQRAATGASYQEIYDLLDDNLYNPNWGWQDGKKRSAKIVEQFDPTAILTWLYKTDRTTVNTSAAFRFSHYASTSLSWNNAADPRCDYYNKLPSYFFDNGQPTAESDLVAHYWLTDKSVRQINWDNLYWANNLNNAYNATLPLNADITDQRGASYIIENRVSNQYMYLFNSYINHRLNSHMNLQAGVSLNYTKADYFKTVDDLLGAEFWWDTDSRAEIDYPGNEELRQNDLNNPDRQVKQGERFGYDYTMHALQLTAWMQNTITTTHLDVNYGLKLGYTQFQRDGHMRNGRAPENSYGKGATHRFDTGSAKIGATYKIDGRNFLMAHAQYESRAPLYEYAYISPRIKDTAISDLSNERIASFDLSYVWNYRRFRGTITGFWTEMMDMTERTSYYDDQYGTNMNYVLSGVHRRYKGVEIGMAYKITPSITATVAGTVARYQYVNRPTGTRSYENGMMPDITQTVYLKNFYVGGTPQTAFNAGIDWAAPKSWFFNVNATWMGNAYVQLTPIRHEALPNLWEKFPNPAELEAKMKSLASQDKMKDAFVVNASIGKLLRINRQVSMNFNLSVTNLLNNRNIQTNAYQQGRFDYTNYDAQKFPNKVQYAQGIRVYLNVGIRF